VAERTIGIFSGLQEHSRDLQAVTLRSPVGHIQRAAGGIRTEKLGVTSRLVI
jgi:hypothetical protein